MRGTLALSAVLIGALVAGCLGNDDVDPAGGSPAGASDRLSTEAWKSTLTEPIYDGIISSIVSLTAEDGAHLSLSLHLPDGLLADAKVPTLVELTPYQSFIFPHVSTPVTGTAGPFDAWSFYVERGAAYVAFDERGTGGSDGCLDFGGSLDRADARVLAEWIRAQPWSNGVIVSDGISHPGMGSVVAHAAIPGLTAALAHAPVVSYYQDEWLQGAKFEDQFNGPLYEVVEISPPLYADAEALLAQAAPCRGQTTLDFSPVDGPFTDVWADRHLARHIEAASGPILLTHGFVDQNVHPDHSQMYWDALPADFPKYAIFGWWYHGWPDMDGHPADEFEDVRHRWLDATLFGIDNGLWNEPRVLVEDSRGTWHEGHDWPLEQSEVVTLYPTVDGAIFATPSEAGEVSYTDALDSRRGRWTDASAVFRTEPLIEERLVNGAPEVTLVASSSESATKWVAYLLDEAPDGSWQRVTHGYADSHTLGEESEWLDMEPGTLYTWTLKLFPTVVVLEPEHRLVLVIASQDSPTLDGIMGTPDNSGFWCWDDHRDGCYSPSGIVPAVTAGRAVNTVLAGPEGTHVTLAWVDPAATRKALDP